jgi:hypothetical protein
VNNAPVAAVDPAVKAAAAAIVQVAIVQVVIAALTVAATAAVARVWIEAVIGPVAEVLAATVVGMARRKWISKSSLPIAFISIIRLTSLSAACAIWIPAPAASSAVSITPSAAPLVPPKTNASMNL